MAATFKQYAIDLSPPALQGTVGQQWHNGFNQHLDDLFTATKDGVKARFPEEAAAAGDDLALGLIGSDRRLDRWSVDTDATYGSRLRNSRDRWEKAGAKGPDGALEVELASLGYTGVKVWTVRDDGAIDGNTTWWSRFWIFITGHPYTNTAHVYGGLDLEYGDNIVYGLSALASDIDQLKKALRTWKPAHAYCVFVRLFIDGAIYYGQAGKTYGGGSTYGGSSLTITIEF